jgi:hypothetical protein
VRKKLFILIEPSPVFNRQGENSQCLGRMEQAADEIRAWGEYPGFIHGIPVVRCIKNTLKLHVEMVADESFLQEAIETLADILSKHSLNVYTYIVASE